MKSYYNRALLFEFGLPLKLRYDSFCFPVDGSEPAAQALDYYITSLVLLLSKV
jgi:hypothetical protein